MHTLNLITRKHQENQNWVIFYKMIDLTGQLVPASSELGCGEWGWWEGQWARREGQPEREGCGERQRRDQRQWPRQAVPGSTRHQALPRLEIRVSLRNGARGQQPELTSAFWCEMWVGCRVPCYICLAFFFCMFVLVFDFFQGFST